MNMINLNTRAVRNVVTSAGVAMAAAFLWAGAAGAATGKVADLVERLNPTVVTVLSTVDTSTNAGDPGAEPPFGEFLERFGVPGDAQPKSKSRRNQAGLGSGIILDAQGYIVTNEHVIDGADRVKVRLGDAREFTARIVGADEATDLALLKIEAEQALDHAVFADSDAVRVGEDVIAVGNPFGLGGTVTRGIISAVGRNINAGPYVDFLQTDAAINRGNSGGALFDLEGRVVGVNSAIYSPSGGSVGVGFAIPSNIVQRVVADLKDDGRVDRGWLGVTIQPVTPEIAEAMGLDKAEGALVAQVAEDGPSHGILRSGDVIRDFGGTLVQSSRDLPKLVGTAEAGDRIAIGVLRDGAEATLSIEIGALACRG